MGPRVEFLVRRLREDGEALTGQLARLAADEWSEAVYPAETAPWTVHSILAHMVSAEGYIRLMMADIVRGGAGAPPGIDIDAVNAAEVAALARFSPSELIAQLSSSRAASVEMVSGFSEADLDRRGNHPLLGEMPVEDFVKLIYRHDKMHMRDVRRAMRA